jgi:hypothetical protein
MSMIFGEAWLRLGRLFSRWRQVSILRTRKAPKQAAAEIDWEFGKMGRDANYQRGSISMCCEFELSDWEAVRDAEHP